MGVYVANQSPTTSVVSPSTKSTKSQTNAGNKKTPSKKPNYAWSHSTSKDKMTGKRSAYASSSTVGPTKKMGFPYGDTKAWLGVGCNGNNEWTYIGFNKPPNLSDTETKDGYNLIRTRIKWDKQVEDVTLNQDWGASFIHFRDNESVITKIVNSKSVLLELKWYGEQTTYFKFPLSGSSASLKNIRSLCSKY